MILSTHAHTPRTHADDRRSGGVAYIIVLAMLLVVSAIVLPFLLTANNDKAAGKAAAESLDTDAAVDAALALAVEKIQEDQLDSIQTVRRVKERLENGGATAQDFRLLQEAYRTYTTETRSWLASLEGISFPIVCIDSRINDFNQDWGTRQVPRGSNMQPDNVGPSDYLLHGRPDWRDPSDSRDIDLFGPYDPDDPTTWADPFTPSTFHEWKQDIWPQMTKVGPYVTLEDPFFDQTLARMNDGLSDDDQIADFEARTAIDLDTYEGEILELSEKFQSNRYVELPYPRTFRTGAGSGSTDDFCFEWFNEQEVRKWNAEKNLFRKSFVENRRTADRPYPVDFAPFGSGNYNRGLFDAFAPEFDTFDPSNPPYARLYDRRWQRLPISSSDGTVWVAAVKIIDTSGLININTASQGSGIGGDLNRNGLMAETAPTGGDIPELEDLRLAGSNSAFGLTPADIDLFGTLGLNRAHNEGGIADTVVLNPAFGDNLSGNLNQALADRDHLSRLEMWSFDVFDRDSTATDSTNDEIAASRYSQYGFVPVSPVRIGFGRDDQAGGGDDITLKDTEYAGARASLWANVGSRLVDTYAPFDFDTLDSKARPAGDERDVFSIAARPFGAESEARLRGFSPSGALVDVALDAESPRSNPSINDPEYLQRLFADRLTAGQRDYPDDTLFYPIDFGALLTDGTSNSALPGVQPLASPLFDKHATPADQQLIEPNPLRFVNTPAGLSPALPSPLPSNAFRRTIVDLPVADHLTTYNATRLVRVDYGSYNTANIDLDGDGTNDGINGYDGNRFTTDDGTNANNSWIAYRLPTPYWLDALDGNLSLPLPRDAANPLSNAPSIDDPRGFKGRVWTDENGNETNGDELFYPLLRGGKSSNASNGRNTIPYYQLDPNRLSAQQIHDVVFTLFTPGWYLQQEYTQSGGPFDFDGSEGAFQRGDETIASERSTFRGYMWDNWYRNDPAAAITGVTALDRTEEALQLASEAAAAYAANVQAYRSPGGYIRTVIGPGPLATPERYVLQEPTVERDARSAAYLLGTNTADFDDNGAPDFRAGGAYPDATDEAYKRTSAVFDYEALRNNNSIIPGSSFPTPNNLQDGLDIRAAGGTFTLDAGNTGHRYIGLEQQPFIVEATAALASRVLVENETVSAESASSMPVGPEHQFFAVELANPYPFDLDLTPFALRIGPNRDFTYPLRGIVIPAAGSPASDYTTDPVNQPNRVVVYIDTYAYTNGTLDTGDPVTSRSSSTLYNPEFDRSTLYTDGTLVPFPPASGDSHQPREVNTLNGAVAQGTALPVNSPAYDTGTVDTLDSPFGLFLSDAAKFRQYYRPADRSLRGIDEFIDRRYLLPPSPGGTPDFSSAVTGAEQVIELVMLEDPWMRDGMQTALGTAGFDINNPDRNPLVVDRLEFQSAASWFPDNADAAIGKAAQNDLLTEIEEEINRYADAFRIMNDNGEDITDILRTVNPGVGFSFDATVKPGDDISPDEIVVWMLTSSSLKRDDRDNQFFGSGEFAGGAPNYIYENSDDIARQTPGAGAAATTARNYIPAFNDDGTLWYAENTIDPNEELGIDGTFVSSYWSSYGDFAAASTDLNVAVTGAQDTLPDTGLSLRGFHEEWFVSKENVTPRRSTDLGNFVNQYMLPEMPASFQLPMKIYGYGYDPSAVFGNTIVSPLIDPSDPSTYIVNAATASPPAIPNDVEGQAIINGGPIDYVGELASIPTIAHRVPLIDSTGTGIPRWQPFTQQLGELWEKERVRIGARPTEPTNTPNDVNARNEPPLAIATMPGSFLGLATPPREFPLQTGSASPLDDADDRRLSAVAETLEDPNLMSGFAASPNPAVTFADYARQMATIGRLDFTRAVANFGGFTRFSGGANDPGSLGPQADPAYFGQDSSLDLPVATLIFDVFDTLTYRPDLSTNPLNNDRTTVRPEVPVISGKVNVNTATLTTLAALPGLNHFNKPFPGLRGPNPSLFIGGAQRPTPQYEDANPAVGILLYRELAADPRIARTDNPSSGQGFSLTLDNDTSIPNQGGYGTIPGVNEPSKRQIADYRVRGLTTGISGLRGFRNLTSPGTQFPDNPLTTTTPRGPSYNRDFLRFHYGFPYLPDWGDFLGDGDSIALNLDRDVAEGDRISSVAGFATVGELLAVRNAFRPSFALDALGVDLDNSVDLRYSDARNQVAATGVVTPQYQIDINNDDPLNLQNDGNPIDISNRNITNTSGPAGVPPSSTLVPIRASGSNPSSESDDVYFPRFNVAGNTNNVMTIHGRNTVDPTPDNAVDDHEEQTMLFQRLANVVDVRSDTFLVEVELRGLRFDPDRAVDGDRDGNLDYSNPMDQGVDLDGDGVIDGAWYTATTRKFAAIIDRSTVWSNADRPRIVFFSQDKPSANEQLLVQD